MDVDLQTVDGSGATIPLIVSNMTAISGRRMAETVARRGGLTVIPQDIPIPVVSDVIAWMKSRHILFDTPITLQPTNTVADAASLIHKRAHGAIIIVEDAKPVGILTEADWEGADRFTQIHRVMSKDLLVIPDSLDAKSAFQLLHEKNRKLAPVVDSTGKLIGILTRTSSLRATLYQPTLDAKGKLRIAAAVGVNGDVKEKVAGLVAAGVDLLVVDTAHGHQEKMIEVLKVIRPIAGGLPIVAGNVVTAEGVRDLVGAGADIVKVGVGPGAMCTTRKENSSGQMAACAIQEMWR